MSARQYRSARIWRVSITTFHDVVVGGKPTQRQKGEVVGVVASCLENALQAVRDKYPEARFDQVLIGDPVDIIYETPQAVDVLNRLVEAAP